MNANDGVANQRPNRIGSGTLANPTIDLWFDKTAFLVPDQYTFGNSGAGILRADHQWNVDASLFKRFGMPGAKCQRSPPSCTGRAPRGPSLPSVFRPTTPPTPN